MKALHSSRRTLILTTLTVALGLAPRHGQAADPISLIQMVAAASTVISPITGVLSLVLDIAKVLGDYEGQKTVSRVKRYQDTYQHSYRGSSLYRTRTEWLVGDSGPYFRTDEWRIAPDGTVTYGHDSDPFFHGLEQRTYRCTTSDGMDVSLDSSLQMEMGYAVVRDSSLSYFLGPDPMPVTVTWCGRYLTESCLDSDKGGFTVTRERFAPRNGWGYLSLPSSKSMEILCLDLTPHQ